MLQTSNGSADRHRFLVKKFASLIDETLLNGQKEIAYKLIMRTFELADKVYRDGNEPLKEK